MANSTPALHQFSSSTVQPYESAHPKRRETFEVMLRRFNREIQLSGILTEAKRRKHFEKDSSRTIKKRAAIRKAERKKQLRGY